jgi:hypothetical protein
LKSKFIDFLRIVKPHPGVSCAHERKKVSRQTGNQTRSFKEWVLCGCKEQGYGYPSDDV